MKILKPTFLMLIVFVSVSAFAQEAKVILYNSEPVTVHLDGDHIAAFVGEAPRDYMKDYDLSRRDVLKVNSTTVKGPIIASTEDRNADYSVLSSERILLTYKSNFATLNKVTIAELNNIAVRLKNDPSSKILLTAQVNESDVSKKLAENRMQATVMYLKIKGISNDRIETNSLVGEGSPDIVGINFLR